MVKKVVLVDDDELFLSSMRRELGEQLEVVGFSCALDAIDYLMVEVDSVDLICVDLQMHDIHGVFWQLGGLNVIQTIKRELNGQTPPICALTGMDATVHIHTCLKNGADDFLEKGADLRDVARRLMATAPLAQAG